MMRTIQLTFPLPQPGRAGWPCGVLAIGDFDGVHRGHQEVISRAVERGKELGLPAAIMTFHPHPRQVLGMDKYTRLLTPLSAKEERLRELGVDTLYIVDFSKSFMCVTPEQFVEEMLVPLGVNTVFVGFDFTFGHRGAGTPDTLCELAAGRFAVEVVRPYHIDGHKVSSTLVREALLAGRIRQATHLLGRPYHVRGKVVHGDGRGHSIGFPTANVEVTAPYVVPVNGVYAVQVEVRGHKRAGVMNLGVKPTFGSHVEEPVFEAHLFDFDDSLYGEEVRVDFIEYIRAERKFESVPELIEQIGRDAREARSLLSEENSSELS
ncbi:MULTISPECIES: bifunctional riboflavin kinase/FAD synthetase [Paenibacillus]|uniref:bifunctional riboflavin kinase/FAD synthetase n=1 Tax=Paenibacillus TaxID=44249 RepID=UPI0022B8A3AB|nr:bifunctional riboflavin kinase/FAD synthetase [Paenibacillus caseinilyticus]MCZ8520007.1 bifunctional riboflavin kinase/FAD synthetase [Paenibacillus caseinilyticus]